MDRSPTWKETGSEFIHMTYNQNHYFLQSHSLVQYLVMLFGKVLVIELVSVDGLATSTVASCEVSPLS